MSFLKRYVATKRLRSVDEDLPLGLKLGKKVRVDEVPFILGDGALKISKPTGELVVQAVGQFKLANLLYYRLYLADEIGSDYLLQVVINRGVIAEICFFSQVSEVFPKTIEELGWWISPGGKIGAKTFAIRDFEGSLMETVYRRAWVPHQDYLEPPEVVEVITDEPLVIGFIQTNRRLMMYECQVIPDVVDEVCLVETFDSGGEAGIAVYAGIPLEPFQLNIA